MTPGCFNMLLRITIILLPPCYHLVATVHSQLSIVTITPHNTTQLITANLVEPFRIFGLPFTTAPLALVKPPPTVVLCFTIGLSANRYNCVKIIPNS